jgi:hypothetical protein
MDGKNLSQFSKGKKIKIVGTVGSNVATTRQSNDGDSLEKRQIAAQRPKKRRFQQVAGLKNQQQV